MDGFDGCSDGFGIGLGPAKAAGEPPQKIVNAAGLEWTVPGVAQHLLLPIVLPMIFFRFLRTARIRNFGHGNLMVIVDHCRRICGLGDAESYAGFRIGRNAVTERGPITPEADGAQNDSVFAGATAVEDKSAVDVAVGADNEAHAHAQIVVFRPEQGVGRKQGFWRTDASAFRQREGLGNGRELGDMRGDSAQRFF